MAEQDTGYDQKEAYYFIARCLAAAMCTKNSNWDDEDYKQGVIEPYKKVQERFYQLEAANQLPAVEQLKEAFEMVHTVFRSKGVDQEEQAQRIDRLLNETGMRSLFVE